VQTAAHLTHDTQSECPSSTYRHEPDVASQARTVLGKRLRRHARDIVCVHHETERGATACKNGGERRGRGCCGTCQRCPRTRRPRLWCRRRKRHRNDLVSIENRLDRQINQDVNIAHLKHNKADWRSTRAPRYSLFKSDRVIGPKGQHLMERSLKKAREKRVRLQKPYTKRVCHAPAGGQRHATPQLQTVDLRAGFRSKLACE
jgi:hypothetical protein